MKLIIYLIVAIALYCAWWMAAEAQPPGIITIVRPHEPPTVCYIGIDGTYFCN